MRLKITHLKAPWPAGAKVGDVLELLAVPVWAAGKCERAPDDAPCTLGDCLPDIDAKPRAKK